ncbi:MAG TPA: hypothetical protein VJM33_15325 [Microthrixaceae bacterium]|nr:hypothetical protein [Microthrixaceae bacterium]
MSAFDVDDFVERCVVAGREDEPRLAMVEVLEQAVADPDAIIASLPPTTGALNVLYGSAELTVLHLVWTPHMELPAHDHRMWAAIAIYAGKEDNTFYRRSASDPTTIDTSGGTTLETGDVQLLGRETIHSVVNPSTRHTGAIHVYGGDFVHEPRSQWGPGELRERPYDMDYIRDLFAAEAAGQRSTETSPQ